MKKGNNLSLVNALWSRIDKHALLLSILLAVITTAIIFVPVTYGMYITYEQDKKIVNTVVELEIAEKYTEDPFGFFQFNDEFYDVAWAGCRYYLKFKGRSGCVEVSAKEYDLYHVGDFVQVEVEERFYVDTNQKYYESYVIKKD